jgi:hypothetical protein
MGEEDHPALPPSVPDTPATVFDPDHVISKALLNHLASATSTTSQDLCQPFVRFGHILTSASEDPVPFKRGLLDTGAQGSNFISNTLYTSLPCTHRATTRAIDRVVRLGDTRHLSVQLEVLLLTSIYDSKGIPHSHQLWYSVLDSLSHDLIIGLVDLIGPYYDLFEDALLTSRHLSATKQLGSHLTSLTDKVQKVTGHTADLLFHQHTVHSISAHHRLYTDRKRSICNSPSTKVQLLALEDGSSTELLLHPTCDPVYADNRVENYYDTLSSLLTEPTPGAILPPWSQPIDSVAPEETDTPDPTSFPDDILAYLTSTPEEARLIYLHDLETHVTDDMKNACPDIMLLLRSQLALDVFVPSTWTGILMEPYHLEVKPGLPDHLKARARPVRAALFQDAKNEFDRMRTYFYEQSTSPIACPLVVAPKATTPFIRLCGDYRPINPYICIPQEPIPNVQQSLAKAAGWKVFVDLDMTNSFHQIPIDDFSSNLLSVSTPWGLFRPKFLPEGVGPASGILQAIVRNIFADFDDWTIVIFDNFLVLASDYQDALSKLKRILQRCQQHHLVLKMKKSWIGTTIVTFFGYEVHPGSWRLSKSRKDAINQIIFPTSQKIMQSFLGAANFFHTHIPNYADWASSLYECTVSGFNWNPLTWTKDYKGLFETFKLAIQNSATLHFPNYSLPWVIRSDASDIAVGAVLFQEFADAAGAITHQPIAFVSHKFSGAAVNWDTFKQEAFALYFAISKLSYYLRGKEFLLETDHRNLLWIEASQVPIVVRWRVLLQSYTFTVKHIPGTANSVADWLSRMYPSTPTTHIVTNTAIDSYPPLPDMFSSVHGGRNLHHGARRTYLTLCQRYPGHGVPMRVIQDLVSECPQCQKDRCPAQPIPHSSVTQTLMQHKRSIGIDHVTVTPPDEDGYTGLLLVVEHDTKFPQAYPIKDYTALTVATVLFRHYCTFGTYDSIYSDPGSSLLATVVAHLNSWLGTNHYISLIGRHESNGTEHTNGIFMGHLRRLVHDERLTHRWASDTVLPLINHALSVTPNAELGGLSPAALKFGTLDSHRFQFPQPLPPGHSYHDFITRLDENLATVRSITNDYQCSLRTKRQAPTPPAHQNQYQPHDLILWNPKEHNHSFRSSKLAPKLLGPYTVQSQLGNEVTCTHCQLQTTHVFHCDRITPFFGTHASAKTIGLLDKEEFIIDSILSHRGSLKNRSTLQFLVRWSGYTADDDTWEPYANLRHAFPLHAYLQQIKQTQLIPKSHRSDATPTLRK